MASGSLPCSRTPFEAPRAQNMALPTGEVEGAEHSKVLEALEGGVVGGLKQGQNYST